jgi:hypothetical protein
MAVRLSAYAPSALNLPGRFLVLISVRGLVDPGAIVRLEELGQLKNLITSSGFEPPTFPLVAQCLNQLRYRLPPYKSVHINNTITAFEYKFSKLNQSDLQISIFIQGVSLREISNYDIMLYQHFLRQTHKFCSCLHYSGVQHCPLSEVHKLCQTSFVWVMLNVLNIALWLQHIHPLKRSTSRFSI